MKPIFEGNKILNSIFGLILVGLGAAGLGLQANWFTERSNYTAYTAVVETTTGLKTVGTSLDVAVAGAAIVLAGGFIALVSALINSKTSRLTYILGLAIALVGGIVQLAGGVSVNSSPFLKHLGPETYVNNANVPVSAVNPTPSAEQQKMALFGLAVWDRCCFAENWHKQTPFAACGQTCPSPTNGNFLDPRILTFRDSLPLDQLCTCVKTADETTYQQYRSALNAPQCAELAKTRIIFDPAIVIPQTAERGLPLSLGTIKDLYYKNTKIIRAPLVGFPLDPVEDPLQRTQEGFGFGCGLGYQKGVMWFQEIYHQQFIITSAQSAIGLGVAALAVVILEFILGGFLAREDNDMDDGKWEGSLAASWNQPVAGAPVVAAAAPQVANSYTAPPVAAYQSQDFSDQLLKFYARYDPAKTQREIDQIAGWGRQNGLAALNKKLRDKYGADLGGGDAGPPV